MFWDFKGRKYILCRRHPFLAPRRWCTDYQYCVEPAQLTCANNPTGGSGFLVHKSLVPRIRCYSHINGHPDSHGTISLTAHDTSRRHPVHRLCLHVPPPLPFLVYMSHSPGDLLLMLLPRLQIVMTKFMLTPRTVFCCHFACCNRVTL
jgi:hypothetical protein